MSSSSTARRSDGGAENIRALAKPKKCIGAIAKYAMTPPMMHHSAISPRDRGDDFNSQCLFRLSAHFLNNDLLFNILCGTASGGQIDSQPGLPKPSRYNR